MRFLLRLIITAAIAYGLATMLSGVWVDSFGAALLFAFILALLNIFVKPLLVILTIPVTVLTLGLFLLVINAFIILLADYFIDGIRFDGFWWALLFSIILSITSGILESVFDCEERT